MAMPVLSAKTVWGLLAVRPGRIEYTLRLAVICALTCLIAEIYQTPDIALTIYIAFFLNKNNRPASLIQNIAFVALISVVVGLIIVIAATVLDHPMWRVAAIAIISVACLFLASASKLRPVGGTLALVMAYALDLLGIVPVGEAATRALLYAWLFVGIPAGVSIAVNLLFAPSPRRAVERELAFRLRLASAQLRGAKEGELQQFEEVIREGRTPLLGLIRLAHLERSVSSEEIAEFRQAILSTLSILCAIDATRREPETALPQTAAAIFAESFDTVAHDLECGKLPRSIHIDLPVISGAALLVAETLRSALRSFGEPLPEIPHEKAQGKGFFLPDAFTNPDHVRYALKTTAAAMICYVLYSSLDWSGIHTCFITCYIVSLTTAAESVEKLTLRILGCLVGAAVGFAAILWVMPQVTSIGVLMLIVSLGAAASAYVAGGNARISYAGFQIAFAFFLCVVQGPSPDFDFIVARDRVVGILLGNLVSYLVFANVWPVSIGRRIDPAIGALLRRLATVAGEEGRQARICAAADLQMAIGTIQSDLHLVRLEPERFRPSVSWSDPRRAMADEMACMASLLSLSHYNFPMPIVAHSLDRAADAIGEPTSIPEPEIEISADAPGLIEKHLHALWASLRQCFTDKRIDRDALH
jgi:multidrug resistance protein MdtO